MMARGVPGEGEVVSAGVAVGTVACVEVGIGLACPLVGPVVPPNWQAVSRKSSAMQIR
jgi:hypothetical protein